MHLNQTYFKKKTFFQSHLNPPFVYSFSTVSTLGGSQLADLAKIVATRRRHLPLSLSPTFDPPKDLARKKSRPAAAVEKWGRHVCETTQRNQCYKLLKGKFIGVVFHQVILCSKRLTVSACWNCLACLLKQQQLSENESPDFSVRK